MKSKIRYVVVEGEYKMVYSTSDYNSAKRVLEAYTDHYASMPVCIRKYFTLYEMTKLEVASEQEQKEVR